jgi:hypothetical protein
VPEYAIQPDRVGLTRLTIRVPLHGAGHSELIAPVGYLGELHAGRVRAVSFLAQQWWGLSAKLATHETNLPFQM